MGDREAEGSPAPGQLSLRPDQASQYSASSWLCPALPSKAPLWSATPGSPEQGEVGSSHGASSRALCVPSVKLAKTSLVVRTWEGQAQNPRADIEGVQIQPFLPGSFGKAANPLCPSLSSEVGGGSKVTIRGWLGVPSSAWCRGRNPPYSLLTLVTGSDRCGVNLGFPM